MHLILTDGSSRRRRERQVYNRVAEALEREARRLRRFADEDLPAFERWVETTFVTEMTTLRELERKVAELRGLIADVRRYAELTRASERKAYELILAARDSGREEALWQEAYGPRVAREETHRERHEEKNYDWIRDEVSTAEPRGGAVTEYLKGLYRKLVRILHPDTQGGSGDEASRKLWHEVQAAYEWGDVQSMERLYKSVVKQDENKPVFSLETCSIGEIVDLRREMERRLETLLEKVKEGKEHPAWDFAGTRKNDKRLRKLIALVSGDMKRDAADLRRVEAMLEKAVARWKK